MRATWKSRPAALAIVVLIGGSSALLAMETINFRGLDHTSTGQATLEVVPAAGQHDRLVLSNIGSSGQDGVDIDLPGAPGAWTANGSWDPTPTGGMWNFHVWNEVISVAKATVAAVGTNAVEVTVSYGGVGATKQKIDAYFGEDIVATVNGHPDGLPAGSAAEAPDSVLARVGDASRGANVGAADRVLPHFTTIDSVYYYPTPILFTLANGQEVLADQIIISPEDASVAPEGLTRVEIRAVEMREIVIFDEAVMTIDHFLGYRIRTTPFAPRIVSLLDQFEEARYEVLRAVELLNPVDKNSEGILDEDTHLMRYDILLAEGEPPHEPVSGITVDNQFGSLIVDTVRPVSLFVPSAKALQPPLPPAPDPDAHRVDHYKCYAVTVTPGTPPFDPVLVTLVDQFDQPKEFDVFRPAALCNPVDKNNEGIKNPEDHLMCYAARPRQGEPPHQSVQGITNNQFGPLRFRTFREQELCVPSKKTLSSGS